MKTIGFGLIAALAFGSAAAADDGQSDLNWIPPKFDAVKARWPHDASGALVYGAVTLNCGVDAKGFAADCRFESPEPSDPAIKKAAIDAAALFKARDRTLSRAKLDLKVVYDEPPDWLHKPTFTDLMAVFPVDANGVAGKAVISCIVKTDGLVRACKVLQETPPGHGFGGAAVILAQTFLFKPAIKQGQPTETEVSVPVNFDATGVPSSRSATIRVIGTPAWSKTPTIQEILAELDKKVGDKFADGKVVFQCEVAKSTGHLSGCIVTNTSQGMAGFTGAARSLTSKFEINKEILEGIKDKVRVNLAFSFPDMQSEAWSTRYLAHPIWLQTVSPNPHQPLFPEAAVKAGLKTGTATVDCVLSATGALTRCTTVSESTPGVGFGERAQLIAQTFVANPWTEDGLPADGAHVRMPVRMNYEPAQTMTPGEAAAPAAPTPSTKP